MQDYSKAQTDYRDANKKRILRQMAIGRACVCVLTSLTHPRLMPLCFPLSSPYPYFAAHHCVELNLKPGAQLISLKTNRLDLISGNVAQLAYFYTEY